MKKLIISLILLLPLQVQGQYLYFSPTGGCSVDGIGCLEMYQKFYIFISAEDTPGINGSSFRVEADEYSDFTMDNVLSVEPHDQVTIVGGDLITGMELSWPADLYGFDTLLTVTLDPDNLPWWSWSVFTRDIVLYRESNDPLSLPDFLFYCSHCYSGGGGFYWVNPDTMIAVIGAETIIELEALGYSSGGFSGTLFDVFDELGWYQGCIDCSCWINCGMCPWDLQTVQVRINIPPEIEQGTIDRVRVIPTGPCCMSDSTFVYVIAVPDISVENANSWGRLKSLHKD